jgi:hypothetical protein
MEFPSADISPYLPPSGANLTDGTLIAAKADARNWRAATMVVHEGGCLCGGIRYRVRGRPTRAFACHCRFCQRRTGTALGVVTFFPRESVEFSGPAAASFRTTSDESGRWIRLDFCPRCGTNLGVALEHLPAQYVVSGGTFDDPNWFELSSHIWTRSKVKWMVLPEGCEWHETSPAAGPRVPTPPSDAGV